MLQQWNLSFEKQLGQSWSANANYIGNHGVHNAIPGDFNPAIYIPGNCTANGNCPARYAADPDGLKTNGACTSLTNTQQRRLLSLINPTEGQLISTGLDYTDNGASSYNGLLLSLQKRVSHNFTMTANYTWSHCIDNGEATTSVNSPAFRNDLKDEYGNCIFDRNQQFTANAVYESPIFRSRIAQTILGNWQISPIVSYLTSDWLSVTTNADSAFIGIPSTVNDVGQRPDSVPGQAIYVPHTQLPVTVANRVVTSGHLGVQWINPKAFVAPTVTPGFTGNIINNGIGPITVGPLGNVGRNTIKGPSIRGFHFALTRKFKINERNEIDARFEAFNVFNMVNYGDPSLTLKSSQFGGVYERSSGRRGEFSWIQFADRPEDHAVRIEVDILSCSTRGEVEPPHPKQFLHLAALFCSMLRESFVSRVGFNRLERFKFRSWSLKKKSVLERVPRYEHDAFTVGRVRDARPFCRTACHPSSFSGSRAGKEARPKHR